MVRGLPTEPVASLGARLRAAPFFVNNLAPGPRATWIRLARRAGVGRSMAAVARVRPDEPVPPDVAGTPAAVVIDEAGILLGAVDVPARGRAVDVMDPAPQTIRPDMTHALAAALLRRAPYLLVTTADGVHLGRYVAATDAGVPRPSHAPTAS
jgi:hypothetical protein